MLEKTLLRLSVTPICNLRCKYCPPVMENRAPKKCDNLSVGQVTEFLGCAVRFGIKGVTLTGGEPWLRKDLVDLVQGIKSVGSITRLEITTNGTANAPQDVEKIVAAGITHAKLSMDTLDPAGYEQMTGKPFHSRVLENLAAYKSTGIPTTVNCVLTKSTLAEVPALIDFAVRHGYNLSLLDLVRDPATHQFWASEFCRTSEAEEMVRRITRQDGRLFDRFGCRTVEYETGGISIHLKDSTVTMRTARCQRCREYCQEGLFALRLSTDGWLTTCPNASPENGIFVVENEDAIREFLPAMAREFSTAVRTCSFEHFTRCSS